MSSDLMVSVVIGATLRSGFQAVFGRAQNAANRLGSEIDRVRQRQERLGGTIARAFSHSTRNVGALSRQYQQMGHAIEAATRQQQRLNIAIANQRTHTERRQELRGQLGESVAHSAVLAAPIIKSVKTYIEQENAETELKLVMMDKNGKFGLFDQIRKEAAALGKELPGTTADFYRLGKALKSQGLSDEMLAKGGLRTSAALNILMNMGQEDGGEFFAKMVEARGLKEHEFAQAADLTQRAYFGFGLKKEDLFQSMKYDATTTSILGLNGMEQYKKLLAIEGMGAQMGLEGSSFGTNFSMMLGRMAKGDDEIHNAKKGLPKRVKGFLEKSNVDFEFFDEKGKFKGLESMITELDKLNKIQKEQGEQAALLTAEAIFGVEAARPALIIAKKGMAGFKQNLDIMEQQASMQERIKIKTQTLGSVLESLGGIAEQAAATFGSAFAPELKGFAASASNFIEGTLTPWLEKNKEIIKTVVGLVGGLLGAKIGLLAMVYAWNLVISPVLAVVTAFQKVRAVWQILGLMQFGNLRLLSGSLKLVGSAFGWVVNAGRMLIGFIPTIITAFRTLGAFLLANPIGIALGLLATAAYLLYQNWSGVVGGATLLWQNLCAFIGGIATQISAFFANAWATVQNLFNTAINAILARIMSFNPVAAFQAAFAAVLGFFSGLVGTFSSYGGMLIDGLANGIRAKIGNVMNTIRSMAASVKSAFTGAMQIHSPSRVFRAYGGFMTDGLAIGLEKGSHKPINRIAQLSGSLKRLAAGGTLRGGFNLNGVENLKANLSERISAHSGARSEYQNIQNTQNTQGAITVNFNPTIHAQGGNVGQIETALQMGLREFEQLFARMMADKQRRNY